MIERCTDYRRIKKFLECPVCVSSEIYYLMEIKDGVDLGVWILHPTIHDTTNLTGHANLGDGCRGRDALTSARDAFEWIFTNTDFKFIVAKIPNVKRHAQFMVRWAGMQPSGSSDVDRSYEIGFHDVINCIDMEKAG